MAVSIRPLSLDRETRRLFEYVRRGRSANRAFGLAVEVAQAQAHAVADRIIEASGLVRNQKNQLRWFVEDVAQALASAQGEALVFDLQGVLRKWLDLGLERNTIMLLLRIVCGEVGGIQPDEGRSQNAEVRVQTEDADQVKGQRPKGKGQSGGGGEENRQGESRPKSEARRQNAEVRVQNEDAGQVKGQRPKGKGQSGGGGEERMQSSQMPEKPEAKSQDSKAKTGDGGQENRQEDGVQGQSPKD
jgi:hypothetical protein